MDLGFLGAGIGAGIAVIGASIFLGSWREQAVKQMAQIALEIKRFIFITDFLI